MKIINNVKHLQIIIRNKPVHEHEQVTYTPREDSVIGLDKPIFSA